MFLDLTANNTATESLQGARFYYKGGTSTIQVKALLGGDTRVYTLEVGMGFSVKAGRFASLEIKSTTAQTIEFEVSDDDVFDNRAVLSLSGAMPVSQAQASTLAEGSVSVTASTATQILAADSTRVRAIVNIAADGFIGKDNTVNATKYPVSAGDIVHENTAALWFFSTTAQTVKYFQDSK